jgi:hypothetical protein
VGQITERGRSVAAKIRVSLGATYLPRCEVKVQCRKDRKPPQRLSLPIPRMVRRDVSVISVKQASDFNLPHCLGRLHCGLRKESTTLNAGSPVKWWNTMSASVSGDGV